MPTIKSTLAEAVAQLAKTSDSPTLDAEILLCKALGQGRSHLRAWPDTPLSQQHYREFKALIGQRQHGEPIAYMLGVREFWSREFIVTPDVLIPRPETELLVELALELIPPYQPCRVIDLGTGSGIIAVTLAAERPNAEITATDISPAALDIAKQNANKHEAHNIRFCLSRWFDDVPSGKFDLILSNPPYVAKNDPHLQEGDLRFEPRTALAADENGLADIRIIAETARDRLEPGGGLIVEHGFDQETQVQNLFSELGYKAVQSYRDLAGIPRITSGFVS